MSALGAHGGFGTDPQTTALELCSADRQRSGPQQDQAEESESLLAHRGPPTKKDSVGGMLPSQRVNRQGRSGGSLAALGEMQDGIHQGILSTAARMASRGSVAVAE